MSNIDKRALRDSAESTIGILKNIAGFEPSDIDGSTVELRFETEDGFDTGCDVSIVDQCQKAADVIRALLDELEAKDKRIADLKEAFSIALSAAGIDAPAAAGKGE
ncbi:ead/Ea22-like family protein [Enterobacter ludwigii]